MSFRVHAFLVACVLVAACRGANDVQVAQAPKSCGANGALMSGDGIGDFRIGARVEDVHLKCEVLRDTLLQSGNEGLPERRLAVRFGVDSVEATIDQGKVWRIEVRTPRLRTSDSVGVGSTIEQLMKQPVTYGGYGEGGPFIMLPRHCGFSFQLAGVPGFARTLEAVPRTAEIDLVLILGCENDSGPV